MSQKDTILDVLRRAQQPLEPKITKSEGEAPAARRSAKDRSANDKSPKGDAAKGRSRRPHREGAGGGRGLQRFAHWLSGDFSLPRGGLYLGLMVAVLFAFGAYKIGVRKGSLGGTAYAKNLERPEAPPLPELERRKSSKANLPVGTGRREPGRNDGTRDQGKHSVSDVVPASERVHARPGAAKAAEEKAQREKARQAALREKPITVLRLLSNPDSPANRKTIEAMRDWLRQELAKQSVTELTRVRVYTWLSASSRPGGRKSVCLEATLPQAWGRARFIDALAAFGDQRTGDFRFDFGTLENQAMTVSRKPSEIDAVVAREQTRH